MLWVFVVIAVGVVGLGLLVWYAVRLTRKVADLATEVAVLADRSGQLLDLVAQIELPSESPLDSERSTSRAASDSEADVR